MVEGVGLGGGAGTAHRSCDEVVGVGVSPMVEGVGLGGGAGSAHRSCAEVVGEVVGVRGGSLVVVEVEVSCCADSVAVVGFLGVVMCRCFSLRSLNFACRISCRRRIC